MSALVGAIARRPGVDAPGLARALAEASRRRANAEARSIHDEPSLSLWSVVWRPGSVVAASRLEDGSYVAIAGDPDLRGERPERIFASCSVEATSTSADGAPPPLPDRRWTAAFYRPGSARIRLLGDRLGTAWLYIAETPDVILFGPDYGALLATLPALPRVDRETAIVTLALAYAPDDRTCHEGVTILPPGTLIELDAAGAREIRRARPRFGDRAAGLSPAAKEHRLEELIEEAGRVWLPERDDALVLSLSGGNDSKYGVLLLTRRMRRAHAVTFGAPSSFDARMARAITRRLGWEATSYYDHDATDWTGWTRSVSIAGTTGGYQWSGWADAWLTLLERLGNEVMLGFLGDAISGRHLVRAAGSSGSWLDHWMAWSLDEGWADSPVLHSHLASEMREISRARFEAMLRGVDTAYPHQSALHFDWYARQRRHTASQANLIDRHAKPIPFFYTGAMLDFWANLPYEDLERQSLYLRYARTRAPELWPPPRPASFASRALGTARNALAAMVPGLKRALLPTEIDIGRIIAQNRARLADLVEQEGESVSLVADPGRVVASIRGFPGSTEMTSFQIMRLTNWLLVLRTGTPRATGKGSA